MNRKFYRIFSMLSVAFLVCVLTFPVACFAHPERLVDDAALLTQSEAAEVENRLDELSEEYDFDVVVYTTTSRGGVDIVSFADDFYDENGYGMGNRNSGVMLLIDMSDRSWYIDTAGEGIEAFTDYGISEAGDELVPLLGSGDYAGAFMKFADIAEEYIISERSGDAVDIYGTIEEIKDYYIHKEGGLTTTDKIRIVVGVVVGTLGMFLITGIMKKKMKSVQPRNDAKEYAKGDTFRLTFQNDIYLYNRVMSVPISDGGGGGGHSGGSSTHSSGGGVSHGGGGGHF